MQSLPDSKTRPRKREDRLSKNGKWRSFPKVPHLLQYVISGNYFGKVKINGRKIRQSLQTSVWSTAQLRLNDFLKEHRENRNKVEPPKFSEVVELFKQELANDTTIKPRSKEYRLLCLQKIQTSWPGLWRMRLDEITAKVCKEWAAKLNSEIASHYFNNTIGALRQVIDVGLKAHKNSGGTVFENPAADLKRVKVKQKDLQLPEPTHFKGLIENLRKNSGAWGDRVADLVEFLAYGGMRIYSEAAFVTWEDVDWQRKQIVVRGIPKRGQKTARFDGCQCCQTWRSC